MAGLVGLKGTFSLYGLAIAELTDVTVDMTKEDHNVSDLGDVIVQHVGGQTNILVTGNATYLARAASIWSRALVMAKSVCVTGIFKLNDPKGSLALSGAGPWFDAGFAMPNGPMTQSFRGAINTLS